MLPAHSRPSGNPGFMRGLRRPPSWSTLSRGRAKQQTLNLPLDHLLLDFGDGLRRIEPLRAGLAAVQDGVTTIEPERVFQIVEPLAGRFVAAVHDPAVGLQQRGRSEIAL